MAWEQIGQGNVVAVSDFEQCENSIDEGQRVRIALNTRIAVSQSICDELKKLLVSMGIPDVSVFPMYDPNRCIIIYRKGFAWLPVIAAVILGLIALAIIIVAWQMEREVITSLPPGTLPKVIADVGNTLKTVGISGAVIAGIVAVVILWPKGKRSSA